jgi:hypothetical protein
VISITEMRELVHETQQEQERRAELPHPEGPRHRAAGGIHRLADGDLDRPDARGDPARL